MNIEQVFRWFCKEQKIMPLVREIYYVVRPSHHIYENGDIKRIYVTLDEFIKNSVERSGLFNTFLSLIDAYYYTAGWENYDYLKEKYDFDAINKRWHYFVEKNIFFDESQVIGENIRYKKSIWSDDGDLEVGKITSVTIDKGFYLFVENQDTKLVKKIFASQALDDFSLNFYIKRKKKVYYGSDNK